MHQVNMFECFPDLLPEVQDISVTDLQLDKLYHSEFDLPCFRKYIDCGNIERVMDRLSSYTKDGCISKGIGWSKENPTIIHITKKGTEFDNDGVFHDFKDMAIMLIKKYSKGK